MDAVLDLGYDLNSDDFAELASKYRCAPEVLEGTGLANMECHLAVDYSPFLRFLVELDGAKPTHKKRRYSNSWDEDSEDDDRDKERQEEEDDNDDHNYGINRRKLSRRSSTARY